MWLAALAWIAVDDAGRVVLPPEVVRHLQGAAASYRRGRHAEALGLLREFVANANIGERQAGEAVLRAQGVKLGPLEALVECRVQLALAGGGGKALPKALTPETRPALEAMAFLADRLVAAVDKELAVGFNPAVPQAVVDEDLRRLPDLMESAQTADGLLAAMADLAKPIPPRVRNTAPKTDVVNRNYAAERKELAGQQLQLAERISLLCAQRIPDMLQLARRDQANFKDRLQAVSRLEEAFTLLRAIDGKFRAGRRPAKAIVSKDPVPVRNAAPAKLREVLAKLPKQEQEFIAAAGPLRALAYRFEQGKHWWLRARFGKGTLNGGLAKSLPTNLQSVDSLASPLLLPQPIPKPEDPLARPNAEPPARRHVEIYQVGSDRPPLEWDARSRNALSRRQWQTAFAPAEFQDDARALVRWLDWQEPAVHAVGYLEYQMALYHWGKLLEMAKPAEWTGFDQALADDDRFVVHTYLSRKYNTAAEHSSLNLQPQKTTDPRAKDVYERRGLAWAIALARLELGSMRALYTANEHELSPATFADTNNAKNPNGDMKLMFANRTGGGKPVSAPAPVRPLEKWPPVAAVDAREFEELLWDAARQQYWQFATAVVAPEAAALRDAAGGRRDSEPGPIMLPFEWPLAQRLAVALELVRGYAASFGRSLSDQQRSELGAWDRALGQELDYIMVRRSTAEGAADLLMRQSAPTLTPPSLPTGNPKGTGTGKPDTTKKKAGG